MASVFHFPIGYTDSDSIYQKKGTDFMQRRHSETPRKTTHHRISLQAIKENCTVLFWALRLAFHISPAVLTFWLLLSGLLALLPSAALLYSRQAVAALSGFLATGRGSFEDIAAPLVILGILLTVNGLSKRVNGALIYAVMYDRYYFGMQEYMMDCIRKVDMKTLLDKEFYDDYQYCLYRSGGLTDLLSSGCVLIMKGITVLSLVVTAFTVSVPVGIIAAVCFILTLLLNIRFSSRLVIDNIKYKPLRSKAAYYSGEPKKPGVAKELRIYHNQEKILQNWKQTYKEMIGFDIRFDRARIFLSSLMGGCIYLSIFLMLLYSVYHVAQGSLQVDAFLMIYLLGENLSDSVKTLSGYLFEALRGLQALTLQHRFLTRVPQGQTRLLNQEAILTTADRQQAFSDIVFEGKDLRFSYDGKKEVLHGLDFQIKRGETIALIGSNGSGKSTLVKLLADLYRPDGGELLFYGRNYEDYPEGSVNHFIGMFFQNFYLFHLTLRENVGFGDLKHLKEDSLIQEALKKGGALPLLDRFPEGLEQWLKKDVRKYGMILSGGEQQKVAVSRTHMCDKDILIFDEPAAALDPFAEMEQFRNIREKTEGRTAILISHRVGFARMADRIFVLDNGNLAETGTHDELMQKNGVYADFFRSQAQWYQQEAN